MVKVPHVRLSLGMGKDIGKGVYVQNNLKMNDYIPLIGMEHADRVTQSGKGRNISQHSGLNMNI